MKPKTVWIRGVEYTEDDTPQLPEYKKSDLLPCPFCGGKADWTGKRFKSMMNEELNAGLGNWNPAGSGKPIWKTLWWVGCYNNDCWGPQTYNTDRNLAVSKWNTRK